MEVNVSGNPIRKNSRLAQMWHELSQSLQNEGTYCAEHLEERESGYLDTISLQSTWTSCGTSFGSPCAVADATGQQLSLTLYALQLLKDQNTPWIFAHPAGSKVWHPPEFFAVDRSASAVVRTFDLWLLVIGTTLRNCLTRRAEGGHAPGFCSGASILRNIFAVPVSKREAWVCPRVGMGNAFEIAG